MLGCSALPDYAAPKIRGARTGSEAAQDLIPYRPLVRDDFRARRAPPEVRGHEDQIWAMTCATVMPQPEHQIVVEEIATPTGATAFEGRLHELGFLAMMDRNCSWWNPDAELPLEYVLEHEQIHFAIVEVEARRLNAEAERVSRDVRVVAETRAGATRRAEAEVRGVLQRSADRALRAHRRFDEETRFGFRWDLQRKWLMRVRAELASAAVSSPHP